MAVSPHDAAKRQALIEALKRGATVTAAAAEAGLNRSHAYRLRDQDARVAAVWPPRSRRLRPPQARAGLTSSPDQLERERELRAQALEVLAQLATDEEQPVKARVDAAKALARLELPPVQVEASRQADDDDDDDEPMTTAKAAALVRYQPPSKEVRA